MRMTRRKPKCRIVTRESAEARERRLAKLRERYRRPGVAEARRAACREWGEKNHERQLTLHAERRAAERNEAFARYGAACFCCGESEPMFLSLDHIDGKGSEHRRSVARGISMIAWARRNGWPPIFRTACHSCNQGIHLNGGTCPHNRAANHAAERLLLATLSVSQRAEYAARRCFTVRAAGASYRVERRSGANVMLLDARGRIAGKLCARPKNVPVEHAMLAQKLWLETNEEAFKRAANFTRLR